MKTGGCLQTYGAIFNLIMKAFKSPFPIGLKIDTDCAAAHTIGVNSISCTSCGFKVEPTTVPFSTFKT